MLALPVLAPDLAPGLSRVELPGIFETVVCHMGLPQLVVLELDHLSPKGWGEKRFYGSNGRRKLCHFPVERRIARTKPVAQGSHLGQPLRPGFIWTSGSPQEFANGLRTYASLLTRQLATTNPLSIQTILCELLDTEHPLGTVDLDEVQRARESLMASVTVLKPRICVVAVPGQRSCIQERTEPIVSPVSNVLPTVLAGGVACGEHQ